MAVTLDWFIHHSQLNNIKLIVGNNHLHTEITSVNILDNPDVLKWFKKNELILTTGYIFKDDPDLQRNIIREMKEIGCAGLGVKIKRFFKAIPQPLLDEAEKLDFPIIELPFFYGFSEITQTVYNKLYLQKNQQIQQEQQLISELTNAFFQHKELSYLLKVVADFLNKPVILTDISYACLAMASPATFDSQILNQVAATISTQFMDQENRLTDFNVALDQQRYSLFAMLLPNHLGYLCTINQAQNAPEEEVSLLHKTGQIIALSCEQNNVSKIAHENRAHFFLHFLMHHNQATSEEIKKICSFYGFNYHKTWVCAVFSLQCCSNDAQKRKIIALLKDLLKQTVPDENTVFLCANDALFCTFFLFPQGFSQIQAIKETRQMTALIDQRLKHAAGVPVPIGISRCYSQIHNLHTALDDSLQAFNLQQHLKRNTPASFLHQMPYHLLANYYKQDVDSLIKVTLQPLLDFDAANHTDLTATLKVYFHSKFNSSVAAKTLYLHRNTMLHRIEKIKELLHTDLQDIDENFLLYLGLCSLDLQK